MLRISLEKLDSLFAAINEKQTLYIPADRADGCTGAGTAEPAGGGGSYRNVAAGWAEQSERSEQLWHSDYLSLQAAEPSSNRQ